MEPIREPDLLHRYWGKAMPRQSGGLSTFHFLIYDCLVVAAVTNAWWQNSPALRGTFTRACRSETATVKAWLLFFVALHDLGKWDVRFQLKDASVAIALNPSFTEVDQWQSNGFDHGHAGLSWFHKERTEFGLDERHEEWMRAVASYHGQAPAWDPPAKLQAAHAVTTQDRLAQRDFVSTLRNLFLDPVNGLYDCLKLLSPELIAGICSVCDWVGSNTDYFPYSSRILDPCEYFTSLAGRAELALRGNGAIASDPSVWSNGPLISSNGRLLRSSSDL